MARQSDAFKLGHRVERACRVVPYDWKPSDPPVRPLRIFALDPSESRLHGNMAKVDVPYEPLLPGPQGAIVEVDGREFGNEGEIVQNHAPLNLDDPRLMLGGGLDPSQSDPGFHAQMVYAVCMSLYRRFREALGRSVAWGFEMPNDYTGPVRLRIKPLGVREDNAYYDPDTGELLFGYYAAKKKSTGRNLPGGFVFTCLGHDIVAHECTHALLDGMRAHFTTTTHADVAAFHEGFADIVALLHRFSQREVVRQALKASRGSLATDRLTAIGRQFGETSGEFGPIRNAIDCKPGEMPPPYSKFHEPHERGRSLCAAIYEAFVTIYDRKRARDLRLATGGSGVLNLEDELSTDLLETFTDTAIALAGQFLNICIRAIDYCPPVDIRFGDYLRAVITADMDLVPADPWGYREAWIDAFRRRGIYPDRVPNLGEDTLKWNAPEISIRRVRALSFAELSFDGDPGRSPGVVELQRQAKEIGRLVTEPANREEFGLCDPSKKFPRESGIVEIGLPYVESVRAARRVGPNSEIVFDLVAEVTQRVVRRHKNRKVALYGGATILIDPWGGVRYVIRKRVLNDERDTEAIEFITRQPETYYHMVGDVLTARRSAFKAIHRDRHRIEKKEEEAGMTTKKRLAASSP